MYYLYILRSEKDGKYYTGITDDLGKRIGEHNKGYNKSTRSRRPFALVYTEECADRLIAREREKYFKSGKGRKLRDNILPR